MAEFHSEDELVVFELELLAWKAKTRLERENLAHSIALSCARADKSDPTAYTRTRSRLLNNLAVPADYLKNNSQLRHPQFV